MQEKKIANEVIEQLAENESSEIYTDNKNIMQIQTSFYFKLYTPTKVNYKTQDRLLSNIKTKITQEQKKTLDAPITEEEIKKALFQMEIGKSPGIDGIPV